MKINVLVFRTIALFLFCNPIWSQSSKSNFVDLNFFQVKYDTCSSIESLNNVFSLNSLELKDGEYIALNVIAYAKSVSRRGQHIRSIEVISTIESDLPILSNYVRGEYYGALGGISYASESPKKAEEYLKESVEFLKKTDRKSDLQAKYTSLGMVVSAMGDYKKAHVYYDQALALSSFGSERNNLYLKLNIALTESSSGNFKNAKTHFINALALFKATPDVYAEIRTYGNLGDIYFQQDSLVKAEELYKMGLVLANQNQYDLGKIRFNLSLSDLFNRAKMPDLAYKHRVLYDSLRSELDLSEVSREINSLESKHEIELKNLELDTQRKRNAILWVSSIIFFVLSLMLFVLWKVVQSKNKVLLDKSSRLKTTQVVKKPLKDEQKALIENLEKLMVNQEFYKKANVNLERTAKKLNTNRTYLSEAVNECYKVGFSRWLNELRIKESLILLSDPENNKYSIEGIAKMVGFSSISSFNSNFKAITGLTPSYYRKKS
ncbi:MAG: tetratricopeptide repeat protein [Crocinitomicaceae bacterium]